MLTFIRANLLIIFLFLFTAELSAQKSLPDVSIKDLKGQSISTKQFGEGLSTNNY